MSARHLVSQLGGKWFTTYGYAKCVCHNDGRPSMRLRDSETGKLLVFCHAGCDPKNIIDTLKGRHMLDDTQKADTADEIREREAVKAKKDDNDARIVSEIWRGSVRTLGKATDRYLQGRGITIDIPPSIRHHTGLRHPQDGKKYHCMVAGVQGPHRMVMGVHRTFITPAGKKTSNPQNKFALGHLSGGAVRLAAAAEEMAIGEGLESSLSFQELRKIPTWASLSTSGMRSIVLPDLPHARIIHIAVDKDENQAGEIAAYAAAERFQKEGRDVVFDFPPEGFADWNDYLVHHAAR